MTDFHRPSDELADRAIDRAVREIMSAEPRHGFTYRVMRRLSEPEPRAWSWAGHGLAASAVAALLALAIWIGPSPETARGPALPPPPAPLASPGVPAEPAQAEVPTPLRPQAPAASVSAVAGFVKPVIAPGDHLVSAASLPIDESGDEAENARPAASNVPDGPSLPAISQPAAAIPAIALDPIVIPDITVAPIASVRR